MLVDFPLAEGPSTISDRRAPISRRLSSVNSWPCRSTSRTAEVSTTTSSE
jgi:hypothetical protein